MVHSLLQPAPTPTPTPCTSRKPAAESEGSQAPPNTSHSSSVQCAVQYSAVQSVKAEQRETLTPSGVVGEWENQRKRIQLTRMPMSVGDPPCSLLPCYHLPSTLPYLGTLSPYLLLHKVPASPPPLPHTTTNPMSPCCQLLLGLSPSPALPMPMPMRRTSITQIEGCLG